MSAADPSSEPKGQRKGIEFLAGRETAVGPTLCEQGMAEALRESRADFEGGRFHSSRESLLKAVADKKADLDRAGIESALDAADRQAATTHQRFAHDEVFGSAREAATRILVFPDL